jgi:hypothetical protein
VTKAKGKSEGLLRMIFADERRGVFIDFLSVAKVKSFAKDQTRRK